MERVPTWKEVLRKRKLSAIDAEMDKFKQKQKEEDEAYEVNISI